MQLLQLFGTIKLPSVWLGLMAIVFFHAGETAECPSEGNLTTSRGMLWSPGFPRSYPDNAFCVWVITAPRGEQVKLVLKTVDLEYCTLCHCDYIEVRDGARPDGKLIGRFCKTNKTVVYSEGMQIWVKFKSDSTNKRRGFLANFSRLKLGKRRPVILPANKTSRFITSSNNPAICGSDRQCTWIISADEGFNVRLTLETFAFPTCLGSFIEIRDGPACSSELVGRFCGNEKPPTDICSTGSSLWITFKYKSTRDLQINRFEFMYRAIHCNQDAQKQIFTGPRPVNNGHFKSMAAGIACSGLFLFVILVTCFIKIASTHRLVGLVSTTSQIELNPTESSMAETPLCNDIDVSLSDLNQESYM